MIINLILISLVLVILIVKDYNLYNNISFISNLIIIILLLIINQKEFKILTFIKVFTISSTLLLINN